MFLFHQKRPFIVCIYYENLRSGRRTVQARNNLSYKVKVLQAINDVEGKCQVGGTEMLFAEIEDVGFLGFPVLHILLRFKVIFALFFMSVFQNLVRCVFIYFVFEHWFAVAFVGATRKVTFDQLCNNWLDCAGVIIADIRIQPSFKVVVFACFLQMVKVVDIV